jgi:hypothetical protein
MVDETSSQSYQERMQLVVDENRKALLRGAIQDAECWLTDLNRQEPPGIDGFERKLAIVGLIHDLRDRLHPEPRR